MMTATAVAERMDAPANVEQGTALTPMQMAFQLVQGGADFASVREMLDYAKGLERESAEVAFNAAMTAAQADMSVVATNMTNTQTKSRYADYAQLDKALRPLYSKHGFALSFDEEAIDKPDYIRIVCHVSHTAGHTRKYHRDMPADGKGAKGGDVMTKTHAAGAAGSYAMRYLLRGIFNIAVGDEDKDGNAVSATITEDQALNLNDLLDEVSGLIPNTTPEKHRAAFMKHMKVDGLGQIKAADYQRAVDAINSTRPKP